jgi:flavin reductase (DIM6/NTAB) family NADH-FMN oxidoreductase RutF
MKEISLVDVDACWPRGERVVLVTSVDDAGKANIIAVGWVMRCNSSPPVFAICLGSKSHSCANISASCEFVISIPGAGLAEQTMSCGTTSGRDVDKFAETGLTPGKSRTVKAPLIQECLANMECAVVATQEMGDHRVFFGEVKACWQSEHGERPLLTIGNEAGYELLYERGPFRLGAVKE